MRIALIGTGGLGAPLARALIAKGGVSPDDLTLVNRSGRRPASLEACRLATRIEDAGADVVLLALPPDVALTGAFPCPGALVISVMAGVTRAEVAALTGAKRVVRAMSSPAADMGLAFSPWYAPDPAHDDIATTRRLLAATGIEARVPSEDQIDRFTALTGPVPGFVAACAAAMADHAVRSGIDPGTADRAVRQLFLAAAEAMREGPTPARHVSDMIDYAGTTAAGLIALRDAGFQDVIDAGLNAAFDRTRTVGRDRPTSA